MMRLSSIIAVSFFLIGSPAWPAPPKPKGFFYPAGGQVGQTFSVTAAGKFDPWPVEVNLEGDGVKITPEKEAGKFQVEIAGDATPGIRWVRLLNAEGVSLPMPLEVGTLGETCEIEPNNLPDQAQSIDPLPRIINGHLHTEADADLFAVSLNAGQTLIVDLKAYRQLGVPMDAVLQLLTPTGFVLEQNHDAESLDPRIVYTAQQAGTLLIRLFAFPADPNQSISLWHDDRAVYRLSVTTGPFLDYCFPLAAECETGTTVELFGWNLTDNQRPKLLVVPTTLQEQSITLSSIAGEVCVQGTSIATFVEVQPHPSDQPQSLPIPAVVSGTISESREADVYAVELRKNEPILLRVESKKFGFPLHPVLTIRSATDEKQLQKNNVHKKYRDFETVFSPPADGVYHVTISDLLRRGSSRHAYLLSFMNQKGYELTIDDGEFTVAAGQTLEIPVKINRFLNFAEEIEINIEELPADVTCTPVCSKSEGETAKEIKLAVKAGDKPFQGPITIRGTSLGYRACQQTARIKHEFLKNFPAKPWLTITQAKKEGE